jgi:signal transduction histidine kinase
MDVAGRAAASDVLGILVVDDRIANCHAFELALAPLGRTVVAVQSGRDALSALLRQDFALILLDVQMPDIDGYETAQLIRRRARSRRTPIIFITAFERDAPEVMRAYQLGVVDFLFKPVAPEILRAKAQVFVDLHDRTVEVAAQAEALRRAQQVAHEQELESQRRRVEAEALTLADRRKDELLAMVAHELRNPLAPIRAAVDLIESDLSHTSPRTVRILRRQVTHLVRLVDDLLDASSIAAGKVSLRREVVALVDVLAEAITECRPMIDERRHSLAFDPPTHGPTVDGDPVRLVQLFANLINNAVKYTSPGGRIGVELSCQDGCARIEVTDNGRGISPELLPRVFDMFVQERAGLDGERGLGLGLALVRQLAELHGGGVTVASDGAGNGSRFVVTLPAIGMVPRTSTARNLPFPLAVDRPLRAVVVDDNDDLRDLIAEMLTSFGHDVATAENGATGVDLIRARRPDVALVDIGLPIMDGYEVARALRADAGSAGLRLVAMTGHSSESDRTRAREAGFDAHIVKPASASELRDVLIAPR